MSEPTQNKPSDRKDALERARLALWMHENNPPHPVLDAILREAYEALRDSNE